MAETTTHFEIDIKKGANGSRAIDEMKDTISRWMCILRLVLSEYLTNILLPNELKPRRNLRIFDFSNADKSCAIWCAVDNPLMSIASHVHLHFSRNVDGEKAKVILLHIHREGSDEFVDYKMPAVKHIETLHNMLEKLVERTLYVYPAGAEIIKVFYSAEEKMDR